LNVPADHAQGGAEPAATPAGSADVLYSSDLLALAVSLANFPLNDGFEVVGHARSRSCGSELRLGLAVNDEGRIEKIGLKVSACAVGQAAAAIFALGAAGQSAKDIIHAANQIDLWLDGSGALPQWPDFGKLAAVQPHTGRHDALRLAWKAAIEALGREAHGLEA
jgi:NifU-like protein involved in Fe-S cluster formation